MTPAAPIPEYAPVRIADAVSEVQHQLYIVNGVLQRKLEAGRIHPGSAAQELQRLQTALRSLEALRDLVGADAIVSTPDALLAALQGRLVQ